MHRVGILSLVILLSAGAAIPVRPEVPVGRDSAAPDDPLGDSAKSGWVSRANKFDCLPTDVRSSEVVSYGRNSKPNVTVEKKLFEMKARCRNGKLLDAKNKEIRFFRISCWGNPPPDYLEIQRRKHEELEKLKKTYNVVVMTCNPMIM